MEKWKFGVLGLIIVVIIGVAFYFTNNDKASLASKDVFIDTLQKDLINNSKAGGYYSTKIDAPTKNSLALFVSNDNKVQALKMDGLELGSTTYNDDQKTLLVEDKNSLQMLILQHRHLNKMNILTANDTVFPYDLEIIH